MNGVFRKAALAAIGFVLVIGMADAACAQGAAPKKTEDVYKNIKVLKGMNADDLLPTMQFFAGSLGVGCDFCHVEPRDKDDRKQKDTARKMIEMVRAINKDNFEGKREVTCNSCHHGRTEPQGTPPVAQANYRPWDPDSANGLEAQVVPGPSADQLIDNYLKSVGGAAAIQKITTRVVKGTATDSTGRTTALELISKSSDASISIAHLAAGDNVTAHTGDSGWVRAGNGPARDIRSYETDDLRLQDPLYVATHLKQILTKPETRLARMGEREVYQLRGLAWGRVPVRLFLGKETGSLLRLVYFTANAIGNLQTQIDYAEYRELNGSEYPFRWTIARPSSYQVFRVDQVQNNATLDDSKFTKPAPPAK